VLLAAEVVVMSAHEARKHDAGPAPRAQWLGLFLAPAAFFAHLQVRYVLVPWACATNGQLWIHVVGVLSLAIAVMGALAARRTWRSAGSEDPTEAGGAMPRTRMLGVMGVGISLMFILVLLGQWLSAFFFSACQ
jgi:hypothetical protein